MIPRLQLRLMKDFFQQTLAQKLNLLRVSAPVFVNPSSGLNDNLNGVELPVSFDIKGQPENAEIVHSLAKWKRYALKKYGFAQGEGLYTDMIAIRRDEDLDNIHSVYVDQWELGKNHWQRPAATWYPLFPLSARFIVFSEKPRNIWQYSMIISKKSCQEKLPLSALRSW